MKRIGMFNFFALFLLAAVIVGFSMYATKEREEFEKLRLSKVVDHATDAAVATLLDTGELNMDYGDSQKTTVDPNVALDTFVDIFLMSYDMNISEENKLHVRENFIPIFAVCTFDGYYLAQPTLVKAEANYPETSPARDQDWGLVFGPKMPYKFVDTDGAAYALNFGADYSIQMSSNVLAKIEGLPLGMTSKEDVIVQINRIVSTDISATIDKFNETNPNWKNTFYIPAGLTSITGVSPLRGPSVISLVQGVDFSTPHPIASFSIGGGKIAARRMVVGYVRNGINYFCYADSALNISPAVEILDVFSTPRDAALAGYASDVRYLQN